MPADLVLDVERRFPGGPTVTAALATTLRPGEILVLFGPSGSGKTTLVRSVAGLDRPDCGIVAFGGETWSDTDSGTFVPPQRRRVGYVCQEPALFPHLTVRANIEYGLAGVADGVRAERVADLIALLELGDLVNRHPPQLSGGQAQRVALARAVAPGPRLLLLDEPFAALDQPARGRLRRFVRAAITRLEVPAILVTHDRTEAIALGDQMAVLAGGRIRQIGPSLEVFRRPADLVVAQSVGVESVLPARVERSGQGLVELRVGGTLVRAADVEEGAGAPDVFACIRAEDVTLERDIQAGASARNQLPGRVVSIESDGPLERVTVDCGFELAALITRHAREEMALRQGSAVVAAIKATAVHLVPRL
jgi:molybdate transport system ATP-binding protein